jgi:ribosomal-protein-alanine N-acetyltransferase
VSRILLRRLKRDDFSAVLEMFQDFNVMQFIGPRYRGLNINEAQESLKNEFEKPARYVVALKSTDEFVGFCGIKFFDEIPDFSVILRKIFWGRGYAAEACQATFEIIKNETYFDRVEVFIAKNNKASLALATKFGWSLLQEITKEEQVGYLCRKTTTAS